MDELAKGSEWCRLRGWRSAPPPGVGMWADCRCAGEVQHKPLSTSCDQSIETAAHRPPRVAARGRFAPESALAVIVEPQLAVLRHRQ